MLYTNASYFSLNLDIATKTTQPIYVNICKEPKIKVSSSTLKKTSNGKSMSIITSLRVTTNVLHHLITAMKILVQDSSSHFLLVPSYGHLNCKHVLHSPFLIVNITH